MNTGVALLLKRMETHPEEFIMRINHGTSQWGMLIHQFEDHLDEEDHVALKAGIRKCHQEVFTGKVMQSLAGEDESSDEGKHYTSPYLANVTHSGGLTLTVDPTASSGLAWSNRTALSDTLISEAGLEQILATHRAMREETKPKRWWNKSLPELLGRK